MDPNAALNNIREAVGELRQQDDDGVLDGTSQVGFLLESFEALDEWLTKGGFLPEAWREKDEAPRFYVVNNVTKERISRGYESEESANAICYQYNLSAGPGGLYGVENEKGERV